MFELETRLKLFSKSDEDDIEVPLTLGEARDIAKKFEAVRTALRRIIALDDKNVPKFAKTLAETGLKLSH